MWWPIVAMAPKSLFFGWSRKIYSDPNLNGTFQNQKLDNSDALVCWAVDLKVPCSNPWWGTFFLLQNFFGRKCAKRRFPLLTTLSLTDFRIFTFYKKTVWIWGTVRTYTEFHLPKKGPSESVDKKVVQNYLEKYYIP